MSSVSLHSIGLSIFTNQPCSLICGGISVTYNKGVRANPLRYVLQHEIDARRPQGGSVFGIRMDLEEVDWRRGSP